jgi:hypothetical protein
MATSRRALDVYAGKAPKSPIGFTSRSLKRGSAATTKSTKPTGQVNRTRSQAGGAQRERARTLLEKGRNAPGADGSMKSGSVRIRYKTSKQRNLFGGIDSVRSGRRLEFGNSSKLGPSAASKRATARYGKAYSRLNKLQEQRTSAISRLTGKDFSKKSPAMRALAKIERSIKTVNRATDFYDQNPRAAGRRSRSRRR